MSLLDSAGGSLTDAIAAAIEDAIPGADAQVTGTGGHFTVRVVSKAFEGKSLLGKQRLVMKVLTPFMAGDNAPVHAIDRLETIIPE